jgi:AcrR family transcriptional regulator
MLVNKPTVWYLCKMSNYNRKKEPLENRQLILDVATQLIAEVGLDKVSLDAVAKRANLSKGGLMHHFPRKDALIEELFVRGLEIYTQAIQKEIQNGCSSQVAYLKVVLNDQPNDVQKRAMQVLTQVSLYNEQYRQLMRQWYQENVIPDPAANSPADLAAVLVADGIWYAHVFGVHDFLEERREQIVHLFLKN